MSSLDPFRVEIERALEAGHPKAEVARALGVAPTTLSATLDRWSRPEKQKPADEALLALKKLVQE